MTDELTNVPAGWYDDGSGRQRWFDGEQWGAYSPDETAAADPEPVVVRRNRKSPFVAPAPAADEQSGITVSRSWGLGLRSAKTSSGLTRNRKIAGDLPGWCPLPPGELGVDRSAGTRR